MYSVGQSNTHLSLILELICNKLQITETQHATAEEKYNAVGKWLADPDSQLHMYNPSIYPQGSFRIGTTVKPLTREEYDIDLVCQLQKDSDITDPMVLLENVYQRIKSNETYEPMSEKKNRCVRIKYKGNFHLDILPAKSDPYASSNCLLVPDRDIKGWKASNPIGYAEWFEETARVPIKFLEKARVEPLPRYETLSDKLPLQQTVQLLKRWRDITFKDKEDFAPVSIVLTTLAGRNYRKELLVTEALTTVLSGVLQEIEGSTGPLEVLNPTNSKECLSEKWFEDDRSYYMFVETLKEFKQKWDQLFHIKGISELTIRLEKLFGEKPVKIAIKEYGQKFDTLRSDEKLAVNKNTGILTGLSTTAIPIKNNTFYGAQED